jgi:hypothetical protein
MFKSIIVKMSISAFRKLTCQFKTLETQLINKYNEVEKWDPSPNIIKQQYYNYKSKQITKEVEQLKMVFHEILTYEEALKVLFAEDEHFKIMSAYRQSMETIIILHRKHFGIVNQCLTLSDPSKDTEFEDIDLR